MYVGAEIVPDLASKAPASSFLCLFCHRLESVSKICKLHKPTSVCVAIYDFLTGRLRGWRRNCGVKIFGWIFSLFLQDLLFPPLATFPLDTWLPHCCLSINNILRIKHYLSVDVSSPPACIFLKKLFKYFKCHLKYLNFKIIF